MTREFNGLTIHTDVARSLQTFGLREHIQRPQGVKIMKTVPDLDRYADLIHERRPDVIVECGTRFGGSALWFEAQDVDVITVDIDPGGALPTTRSLWRRTVQIVGDAAAPATVEAVVRRIAMRQYRRVMVVLDDLHTAEHVAREIPQYRELVSIGQYLVVEDGIFDFAEHEQLERLMLGDLVTGGPLTAISQTLPADPRFVRDEDIETAYGPITHHPAGWWRRES